MLRRSIATLIGVLPLAGLMACASAGPPPTTITDSMTAVATVEAVDLRTRDVLLRRPDGQLMTVQAGPAVRNLAQVRPGDQVRVTYEQAVALRLSPPGSILPASGSSGAARAPAGQRPAGAAFDAVMVRVRIRAVDRASNTVSFTGPRGELHTLTLRDPAVIEFVRDLRPGDDVDVEYVEALAITVEPVTR